MIDSKSNEIDDHTKKKTHYEIINKKIDASFTYKDLNDLLVDIYSKHKNAFKVNIGFGFILYNPHTGESKYFYVSSNNMLFEHAVVIHNRKGLTNLMKRIISMDLATTYYFMRPTSNWTMAGLINLEIRIFNLNGTIG